MICIGEEDTADKARRAAEEILNLTFVSWAGTAQSLNKFLEKSTS